MFGPVQTPPKGSRGCSSISSSGGSSSSSNSSSSSSSRERDLFNPKLCTLYILTVDLENLNIIKHKC